MKKDHKFYLISSTILIATVIIVLIQSESQIPEDVAQVQQMSDNTITGTPADNYSEKERATHCGTSNFRSNSFIKEFEIPTACSQPVGIVVDNDGKVWFTETNTGNVGRFDPRTEEFVEIENEFWPDGSNSMMWGISLTQDNEIWFTLSIIGCCESLCASSAALAVWIGILACSVLIPLSKR